MAYASIPSIAALAPQFCVCRNKRCSCPATERALRYIASQCPGVYFTMDQRDWCLAEIGRFELHRAEQYAGRDDTEVARGVLDAWKAYAKEQL